MSLKNVLELINQKIVDARVRVISEARDTRTFWTKSEAYLLDISVDFVSNKIIIKAIEYAAKPVKLSFKWENDQFFITETRPLTSKEFFDAFDRILKAPSTPISTLG